MDEGIKKSNGEGHSKEGWSIDDYMDITETRNGSNEHSKYLRCRQLFKDQIFPGMKGRNAFLLIF